jgi:hypothetical protein
VSDADFYRPVLYTWTTASSVEALRASHVLLVATASSGGFVSPYHRAVAKLASAGSEIGRILRDDPDLARCRYAWPAPFATVRGLGAHAYGNALIRIELRPEAWIGRFDPAAADPFSFVDVTGARVDPAAVLAHPERIGAIFHVHLDRSRAAFREYVVCSPAMIASWSMATPEIRAELDAEIALAIALRSQTSSHGEPASPATPTWSSGVAPSSTLARWHAALAFDTAKYRLDPFRLGQLIEALAAYDPMGDALTVTPSP